MGLEILTGEVEGKLSSIEVLTPAAPWRPWAGETEIHGRPPELFKALRNQPFRRQTREQAAARRRAALRRRLQVRTEETWPTRASPGAGVMATGRMVGDEISWPLLRDLSDEGRTTTW
jgi:hypothetical protein